MCETCVTGNTGLPGDHAQEAVMTSTLKKTETSEISVGSRVRTRHSVDRSGDRETWPLEGGVIVEDFAAYVEPASVNRDWAVAHRWAVAVRWCTTTTAWSSSVCSTRVRRGRSPSRTHCFPTT